MMRRGARLHRHHARRQLGEERDKLAAREFARHNDLALRVDRVNLKHPLRQIETNPRDSRQIPDRLAHGRLVWDLFVKPSRLLTSSVSYRLCFCPYDQIIRGE